jgi:hypothetical protein
MSETKIEAFVAGYPPSIQGSVRELFTQIVRVKRERDDALEDERLTKAARYPGESEGAGSGPLEGGWTVERGVTCVVCPDCAFAFAAEHEDEPNGGYSCPNCAERVGEGAGSEVERLLDRWRQRQVNIPDDLLGRELSAIYQRFIDELSRALAADRPAGSEVGRTIKNLERVENTLDEGERDMLGMFKRAIEADRSPRYPGESDEAAAFRQGVDEGTRCEVCFDERATLCEVCASAGAFTVKASAPEGAVPRPWRVENDGALVTDGVHRIHVNPMDGNWLANHLNNKGQAPEGAVLVRVWRERANITRLSATHDVLQTIPEGTYNDGVNGWLVIPRTEEGA